MNEHRTAASLSFCCLVTKLIWYLVGTPYLDWDPFQAGLLWPQPDLGSEVWALQAANGVVVGRDDVGEISCISLILPRNLIAPLLLTSPDHSEWTCTSLKESQLNPIHFRICPDGCHSPGN